MCSYVSNWNPIAKHWKQQPETAPQALARFQVLLADKGLRHSLELSEDGEPTLPYLHYQPQNQKLRQLMSGDLAGQAMVQRSTWNRARAWRAVARASFEGSLKQIH